MKYWRIKFAFTLAEVIIVIGIIGIVAEMTLPDLISTYQKQIYVSSFSKAYSTLNQAFKQMAIDGGCINDLSCSGLFTASASDQALGDALVKYFKVAKNCSMTGAYSGGARTGGCYTTHNTKIDNTGGSTYYVVWLSGYYEFITADGMSYSIANYKTDCGSSGTFSESNLCAYIEVDTNGLKGPNVYGRDAFIFYVSKQGNFILPLGSNHTWNTGGALDCDTTKKMGYLCAGRIIEEGRQMNY